MPSVKEVRLPTTPAAIPVAPLIRLAAKSEPGIFGRETLPLPPPAGFPVETEGLLAVGIPPPIDRR
jgi:hypothetical protein